MQNEHTPLASKIRSEGSAPLLGPLTGRAASFRAASFRAASSRAALSPSHLHPGAQAVLRSQRGQGLTEYAVLVSLVAVACIAAMALFGGALQGRISSFVAAIAGESASNIDDGNKKAQAASTKLRQRSAKIDGMKVNTDKNSGEVIDSESLQ